MKTDKSRTSPRWIPTPEVAKLVRPILKRTFPGITFSVRSDGSALNLSWIDGPTEAQVEELLAGFVGGGFDGMIDLAYDNTSWLLPDGTAVFAETTGTAGSAGTVPARERAHGIPPHDDAERVRFASKYIFFDREYSPAFWWPVAKAVAEHTGFDVTSAPPRIRKSWRFKKKLVVDGLDGSGLELRLPETYNARPPFDDFNSVVLIAVHHTAAGDPPNLERI